MTATKQELYNTIDLIPDSVAKELLNYADYLTSKYIGKTMPEDLPTPKKSLKQLEKENKKSLK